MKRKQLKKSRPKRAVKKPSSIKPQVLLRVMWDGAKDAASAKAVFDSQRKAGRIIYDKTVTKVVNVFDTKLGSFVVCTRLTAWDRISREEDNT